MVDFLSSHLWVSLGMLFYIVSVSSSHLYCTIVTIPSILNIVTGAEMGRGDSITLLFNISILLGLNPVSKFKIVLIFFYVFTWLDRFEKS